jgi:hypothetical protein
MSYQEKILSIEDTLAEGTSEHWESTYRMGFSAARRHAADIAKEADAEVARLTAQVSSLTLSVEQLTQHLSGKATNE